MSTSFANPIAPGRVSPMRPVPREIPRPEYVGRSGPKRFRGSDVQNADTIARMRVAGKLAGNALAHVGAAVRPGITTDELDVIAHDYLVDHGAYPSCLGYRGFPKAICTSVNEVICHGIPDSRELVAGDIVNIDLTAYIEGVHGDTNATYLVGGVAPEVAALVERTREATDRAIRAVAPGRRMNVLGRVIEAYANRFGYGVVRDFTGHGISTVFHSGLVVAHYDDPRFATEMVPGMTFTIEPMLTMGTYEWDQWDDGWTVLSGVEILTLPDA
jgi:methionyl aminopeptidase